jgi:hypothetical protein
MRIFMNPTPLKRSLILSLATIVLFQFATACSKTTIVSGPKKKPATTTTTKSKPLPPGQAKKLNGDKSAKSYAPGQQKKKQK